MYPLVHIIVLNWNGFEDTLRCIASLRRLDYENFRITVIDNGSTDESLRAFTAFGDHARLIPLPDNLGYTGGNNFALREAFGRGAEFVWLFNNDAETEPDALTKLVAACKADPTIGLAGPVVLEPANTGDCQSGCGLFNLEMPSYVHTRGAEQTRDWQLQYPDRLTLHGTALLVRRRLYEAIGGFDDSFFAYWEDVDYSIRSVKAGFRNVLVSGSTIYHPTKSTRTTPESIKPHYYYFMCRNELLMWRKFCSRSKFVKAFVWALQRQLREVERMPDYPTGIDAALAGLWHGWRGLGGPHDPTRRMPALMREVLRRNPAFWVRLLGDKSGDGPVTGLIRAEKR
jgi:GT2 family glycosyltransferase